jgi:hypothetical protein
MMGLNIYTVITLHLIILLGLTTAVLLAIIIALVNIIVWHRNDDLNAQRLKILQGDGKLHCRVAKISPWHEKE